MNDTKTFIGVKMINASIMTKGQAYNSGYIKEQDCPNNAEEVLEMGYRVDYGNYISWCPKDIFEKSYFPIENKDRISEQDVNNFIIEGVGIKMGHKTTIVLDTTITGFDTIGTCACVDPINYNQEIGNKIARKDIKDKIWGHLGFVLQWAKNGIID